MSFWIEWNPKKRRLFWKKTRTLQRQYFEEEKRKLQRVHVQGPFQDFFYFPFWDLHRILNNFFSMFRIDFWTEYFRMNIEMNNWIDWIVQTKSWIELNVPSHQLLNWIIFGPDSTFDLMVKVYRRSLARRHEQCVICNL